MRRAQIVLLTIVLSVSLCCQKPYYHSSSEVASAMGALSRAKRYDKASETGLNWLKEHPDDAVIHEQLGMAFLAYAAADSSDKAHLLNNASAQFEDSIRIAPDNALGVVNAAWGFEAIGDLSSGEYRCQSYKKANDALRQHEKLLIAEQPSSPLRRAHDDSITRLAGKIAAANCSRTR